MAITSSGIGSGLDVDGIVQKLMTAESQPLKDYAKKEAAFQARLTGFGTFKSALSSFQSSLSGLNDLSTYSTPTASSSDTTVATASVDDASNGSYSISVSALAKAQSLIATGQASSTASLGNSADTLSFRFGTSGDASSFGAAKTVSITAGSSLQNIVDSVNSADIGVKATIINDGSSSPYRLVFTSTDSGASNSMSITATDSTLISLVNYDEVGSSGTNMTESTAAQDAALTINGISISSASNSVTDAISGVTLNLVDTGSSTITVSRDTSKILPAVQSFIKSYNELASTIKELTGYDANTKKGGTLQGDATILTIQSQLRRTLSSALGTPSGDLSTLNQVGITFGKDGKLSLNSSKLSTAISNNANDVAGLFAAAGEITDSLVSFNSSTDSTVPGTRAINITTIATQGDLVGNVDVSSGSYTIASSTAISVTLDGETASVDLGSGTYTGSELATMLEEAINSNSTFSGNSSSVDVSVDSTTGYLTITSKRYGSASNVVIYDGSGTAVSTYLGTSTATDGVDVAGTVGDETATGSGQYLTTADGLKIRIEGGSTGDRGSVTFSKGFAYQLNLVLESLLKDSGTIKSKTDSIQTSIDDITEQTDKFSAKLALIEKRYRKEFTQLDVLMGKMQQTSSYLTQQLASLSASSSSK